MTNISKRWVALFVAGAALLGAPAAYAGDPLGLKAAGKQVADDSKNDVNQAQHDAVDAAKRPVDDAKQRATGARDKAVGNAQGAVDAQKRKAVGNADNAVQKATGGLLGVKGQ